MVRNLRDDPARAWAPFVPTEADPWDLARVAHLHRRAGFAAPWSILQRDLAAGPAASVDRLLTGDSTGGDGRPAADLDAESDEIGATIGPDATPARLQGAWLLRMILTGHPLRERMTLFWHGHFATSLTKVKDPTLMRRQSDLFRAHALGDFRALLAAIGRDPAMLVSLDASASRKARPNENYARELMELFTLGRGRYTESDVREAARAFTGRFVVRDAFRLVPDQHDDGVKTVLGRTGRLDGEAIPGVLLDQTACAEYLAGKLYRAFVSDVDPPEPGLLGPVAEAFRKANYQIAAPIAMILRSNLFFARASRWRRVKSPVEHAVGSVRALEIGRPTVSAEALADATARMGQALYAPPSVAGWDGGTAWINTTAVLHRTNLALALLGNHDPGLGGRVDPAALARRHGVEPRAFFAGLLLQDAVDPSRFGPETDARAIARLALTTPEYQLA